MCVSSPKEYKAYSKRQPSTAEGLQLGSFEGPTTGAQVSCSQKGHQMVGQLPPQTLCQGLQVSLLTVCPLLATLLCPLHSQSPTWPSLRPNTLSDLPSPSSPSKPNTRMRIKTLIYVVLRRNQRLCLCSLAYLEPAHGTLFPASPVLRLWHVPPCLLKTILSLSALTCWLALGTWGLSVS